MFFKSQLIGKRKRSFSLLEILVVFAIITLVVAVGGIKISQTIANTRFQESYKLLAGKIELARKLAKYTQGGISITINNENPKQGMTLFLDGESLPNSKIKQLLHMQTPLPGIFNIKLESEQDIPSAPICVTFYPSGICASSLIRLDSEATLAVTSSTGNRSPRKIALFRPQDKNLIAEGRDLYPHDLKTPEPPPKTAVSSS